jgi:proteasome beta subunit
VPDASPFGSLPALPQFSPGLDPGPSFVDVLRRVSPHALPGASASITSADAPHGTTVVAIRSAAGVVMAGDRRATAGMMIASRRIDKVFAADDSSGVAIAGAAGPAVEMVRLFQVQLEHYEKVQGTRLSLEGKANQLSMLVRANFPGALQGMVVIPLFAGFDTARGLGRVFSYDITGGRYEELDFQAQGSGSIHARNWIKVSWREGLPEDDAVALAIRALFAAADEDAATGGPDLVRGIYPTMAVIDADGFRRLPEDDVAARSQELLAGPERGGTEAS